MAGLTQAKVLDTVLGFFFESHDFNGIPASEIGDRFQASEASVRSILSRLVERRKVVLAFYSHSGNPHILRIPPLEVSEQISRLSTEDLNQICAYPRTHVIEEKIDLSKYDSQPFTRRIAMAEPTLTPVYFELDVLERYFRDPRFDFEFYDFMGKFSVRSQYFESAEMHERDQVYLQTFGIAYDNDRNRVVAAYLRYLSRLSPEHQQYWKSFECARNCTMNGDYVRSTLFGEWPEHYSAYQALVQEQAEINKIAALIGKPPLFRQTYEESRPAGFAPMLRPTRKNYDEFVHLLDKMLSDNLNRDFFAGDISLETTRTRADGTVQVEPSGTLQLLEK
jgi:hypothetical protein